MKSVFPDFLVLYLSSLYIYIYIYKYKYSFFGLLNKRMGYKNKAWVIWVILFGQFPRYYSHFPDKINKRILKLSKALKRSQRSN